MTETHWHVVNEKIDNKKSVGFADKTLAQLEYGKQAKELKKPYWELIFRGRYYMETRHHDVETNTNGPWLKLYILECNDKCVVGY